MKINSTQNPQDSLYHDARGLLGISVADTTTLSVTEFIRGANARYQRLAYYAWKNSSTWNFDDSNSTTLPTATTTLVAGQEDYSLPTTAMDIIRVEVLDNDGDYVLVREINRNSVEEEALSEFYETDGLPTYWYREANSIILKPAPSADEVTTTAGLKIYLNREVTDFGLTATATEPGFPVAFHRLISYGTAIDFAQKNGMGNLNYLMTEDLRMQQDFNEYYAKRSKSTRAKFDRPRLNTI